MKKMTFRNELLRKIKAGQKTQTRRFIRYSSTGKIIHTYKTGDIVAINDNRFKPGNQGYIEITDIRQDDLFNIEHREAVWEGFLHINEFAMYWQLLHGTYENAPVHVITFKYREELNGKD